MANYETACWDSELSDNTTFEQWSEAGGEDSMIRANKRWKGILAEVEDPPIDPAVDEALVDFVTRRKGSMPDAWY
jgi:trimethylamine--corrinoid protein Co-methyltransferase